MIRIHVSEDALADLEEGFWFYESQEAGLGDYFTSSLRADIEGLKVTGGIHFIAHQDYHRLISRVFPYAIYYTFEDDEVVIWGVVDCRRDPDWIRRHLDE
jgi:hypothetical protein